MVDNGTRRVHELRAGTASLPDVTWSAGTDNVARKLGRSVGPEPDGAARGVRGGRAWMRFLLGFAVLLAVLTAAAEIDASGRLGLAILATVLATALLVERVLYGVAPREALLRLGFGRPGSRALAAAVLVGATVQLVYPLLTALTGAVPQLRPGWPWLLVGLFAFHGLAEELVWRGYAYRRLRAGRSFARAVLWTMPLVALAHLPILAGSGIAVGLAALVVAAVTAVPFARLFDAGRGTIWAPALVHTAIDTFKLVSIPAAALTTFSLLLAATSLVVPLLVLALPCRAPELTPELKQLLDEAAA
jgi:membrane protease YdiL (CAAX protease family)